MKKFKVFHIISRLNIGGPTKLLQSMAKRCNNDFEMIVLTGMQVENEGEILPNCEIIRIKGLEPGATIKETFQAYLQLKKILKKEMPDIIHTHQAKAGFIGRVAAYLSRIKIRIHTFHGHVFTGYFSSFKSLIIQFIEKFLGIISTHVIVISDSIKNDIKNKFKIVSKKKIHLIHIGIEPFSVTSDTTDETRTAFKLPLNKFIFAFIGRLAPIKDPFLFLKIAESFKNENQIHFIMVGNGPLKEECSDYIKSNNLENITLIDWVKDVDLLLNAIDALIMTSLNEGTPLMLLEAMQAGKVTISTPAGGITDIIKHNENGFLCKDSNEFMSLVKDLIQNKVDIEIIKKNAKQKVLKEFNSDLYYKNTLELYQNAFCNIN